VKRTDKPDRAAFRLLMALSPFGDFDGLTADDAYALIFNAGDPEESPIVFRRDVDPGLIEGVGLYRDVVDFLKLVEADQPLKLTQKGNLPVRFCKKSLDTGLAGPDAGWLREGGFRGEMDCEYLHMINILCGLAGLTKKVHGKLSLTRRGEAHLSGKRSLELYKRLFFTYAARFNWAYEDVYPEASSIQANFGFSMYLVCKYGEGPTGIEFYADKFAAAFPFVLASFPGSTAWTTGERFLHCYSLRTFERFLGRFGLVDLRWEKAENTDTGSVQKSDLFDNLITFTLGQSGKGAPSETAGSGKEYERVYEFKITLRDTKPAVWRRIRVPETYTFWDLHVAIQDSMGWFDCHLHEFVVRDPKTGGEVSIGIPDDEFPSPRPLLAGWHERISDWFSEERRTARYDYDFGDGWEHDIRLEKVLSRDEAIEYPVCIDGGMACPPEDVGGTGGYEEFLRILADTSHSEHAEMLEWAGGEFDPTDFDPEAVEFDDPKERLKALRHPW